MRSDVHAPSNMKPEDYDLVGFIAPRQASSEEYLQRTEGQIDVYGEFLEEACEDLGHYFKKDISNLCAVPKPAFQGNHSHKGTCDHCGAAFMYKVVFKHEPTGEHIAVGFQCALNTFAATNLAHAQRVLSKAVKAAKTRAQPDARVRAWVQDPANADIAWVVEDDYWSKFLDGVRRGRELSEKQRELLERITAEKKANGGLTDAEVERKRQEKIAEKGEPVPAGRTAIAGTVLNTKWQDGMYGSALKMLVQDDRGFKVWGSVPSSIDVEKGDQITFSAAVEPSKDDDKFGFFKRPTKASIVV